ncbi:RNA polymerase sigma factor [Chitinophaga qingshengii]|uniref:Sigma-70 family RNA polymerase sigma factor n=1 Tax=Chitinophaga qingshengii TaxID=1569794 RepID=A0ABR7TQX6_9BACT|nr:sigma-70 family RNA polymerase sigma factor [Chitinophaga qingshengii]MBC9932881.1 sigma-70 family RNA polymerase sigma factor [Chitinophaga qingshengii]
MGATKQGIQPVPPANMSDDKDIWKQFCAGEQGAFRELYDRYYSRMFVWGCRWLDGETAFVKDHLHDFFIYLWEKRANLAPEVQVSAYLLTSFKRRLIEQWGKEKKLKDISSMIGPVQEEQEEMEDFTHQFNRIQAALQSLTPAQREVIEMRFLQNMSLQQIAAAKNTSLRTVYNLTHRAILQLRQELGKKNFLFLW